MVTPTAVRAMQATRARMFQSSSRRNAGYVYRENRVPFYQRVFQKHDGKRQWWKTERSPYLLLPYYALNYGLLCWCMWGVGRCALGYKGMWRS